MLVGAGCDQAGIDCKSLTANEPCRKAARDDALEHAAEQIAIAKSLVAGARKRRVIGNRASFVVDKRANN